MSVFGKTVLLRRNRSNTQSLFFRSYFYAVRETLVDVFERSDLDDNGYLSRDEFDSFQLKSGGDLCDDEAWQVMKGNYHQMYS